MELKEAWNTIERACLNDPEYAWAIHCNLAMPIYYCGISHQKANEAASKIMESLFKVRTNTNENYKFSQNK